MQRDVAKRVARRKARVRRRLERGRRNRFVRGAEGTPVIGAGRIRYELSDRTRAIAHGGVGMMLELARSTGLVDEIDRRLQLLELHAPYQGSDHVLAHVLNMLCGGTRLEHLELLRNDESLLNAIVADSIPDPTTAGDFFRRFGPRDLDTLTGAINAAHLHVWKQQPDSFFDEAVIDADGVIVGTSGEGRTSMEMSYTDCSTGPT